MANRKMFPNSVVPLPAGPGLAPSGMVVNAADAAHKTEKMTIHFSFEAPHQDELEARVARGEVVTAQELNGRYAVDPAQVKKLTEWLARQGYDAPHVTPDRTSVYAEAPVDRIESSLGVHMVRVTHDGSTWTAASDVPSLPDEIAAQIHHIGGLQPFRRAHKHSRMRPLKANNRGDDEMAPNVANAPPYLVSELLGAYGANALGVSGKGQEIAILIDTVPLDADLTMFWGLNGIPANLGRITKINVSGATLPPPEGEESLDVEWASGIAPDAAIRVYASGSLQFTALDRALDQIIADAAARPGLRQLSISLGLGETYLHGPGGEVATEHQKFLRLAALGVNVFVSSGDAGSNPDQTGHSSNGPLQAEYEASDPCVVGVGGTSLALGAAGQVASEKAWAGSGGGKSVYFTRPAWQTGASVPAGNQRLVPDVSLAADPQEGALLVLHGKRLQIGGTSWSAPVWAGFCALMNEARQKAGKPALPFLNPLLYPLMGTSCFRDVTAGSNGTYNAGAGYDLVTGLGVPNVKALIAALH
jgi:kumamolisin